MLTEARPVRIDAISCCRSESAFSIFDFRKASTSFTELKFWVDGAVDCSAFIGGCLRKSGSCRAIPCRQSALYLVVRVNPFGMCNLLAAAGDQADILGASLPTSNPTCAW